MSLCVFLKTVKVLDFIHIGNVQNLCWDVDVLDTETCEEKMKWAEFKTSLEHRFVYIFS